MFQTFFTFIVCACIYLACGLQHLIKSLFIVIVKYNIAIINLGYMWHEHCENHICEADCLIFKQQELFSVKQFG